MDNSASRTCQSSITPDLLVLDDLGLNGFTAQQSGDFVWDSSKGAADLSDHIILKTDTAILGPAAGNRPKAHAVARL